MLFTSTTPRRTASRAVPALAVPALAVPALAVLALAAGVLMGGCGEEATAPVPEPELSGGGAAAPVSFAASGLTRHVESYSGSVPGLSNFDLTLTCPRKMFAVSGGHNVGADVNAAQFLISTPVAQPNRWRFVVFNPHNTPRDFEVHVVCLK